MRIKKSINSSEVAMFQSQRVWCVAVVCLVLLAYSCGSSIDDPAFVIVKKQLKCPSTAQLVKLTEVDKRADKHLVHVVIDAQNSYGALVRESYLVCYEIKGSVFEWKGALSCQICPDPPTVGMIDLLKGLNDWDGKDNG